MLGLIALFTHMHIFWVAGLLLALIDLPDFGTPLNRIAGSAEKIAGLKPGEGVTEMPPRRPTAPNTPTKRSTCRRSPRWGEARRSAPATAEPQSLGEQEELIHA